MKTLSRIPKSAGKWLIITILLMFAMVEPATHTILFGGSLGFVYSPNQLIEEQSSGIITQLQFQNIYPNPAFRTNVKIGFLVPSVQKVTLSIYNMEGRKVATLVQGQIESGMHIVDLSSTELSSGTYVCRLHGNKVNTVRNLFIVK